MITRHTYLLSSEPLADHSSILVHPNLGRRRHFSATRAESHRGNLGGEGACPRRIHNDEDDEVGWLVDSIITLCLLVVCDDGTLLQSNVMGPSV